ncbi:VWA domain-containing protein [Paenibacillus sp. M1]|uniref:VWA domain-containing protein n=1 Tax=Paenibacillus haidiansis TaxID=1574488 RepID=A0ABU7VUL2_9BACL
MGFASWAGLWFGLALPAIIIMYLFKRKYVDTAVPSHLLWTRILRNMEANRPWQKLQNRLLLWLQLLAAALLVAALMLPFVWVQGGRQGHTVIIADTSASMSAAAGSEPGGKDERESRLDKMKEQLIAYIDAMGKEEEITLLKLGSQPQVLLSREIDRAALQRAVTAMTADYGPAAYRETLSLAAALTRDDPEANVLIYSDGQWNAAAGSGNIEFEVPVQVVAPGDGGEGNTAVEQFGVKPGRDGVISGIAVVNNYGETPLETSLDVYGDGKLSASKPVSIEGGGSASVSFEELPSAEVYRLALSGEDSYAADNEAFAFREKADSPNILLLSSGNLFLEKALQLTGARVTVMNPAAQAGRESEAKPPAPPGVKPDIVVIDGPAPAFVQDGDWATLLRETPLWTWGGNGEKIRPDNGKTETLTHPVTRYISLADPPTGLLLDAEIPLWGETIISIGGRPAAYAGLEKGQARLVFLFALGDSDLPLRPEFPILVDNAVEWLQSGRATGLGRSLAGAAVDIPLGADIASADWVPADGYALRTGAESIPAEQEKGVILSRQQAPSIPGLWRFESKGADGAELPGFLLEVAADPAESALQGSQPLPIAGAESGAQTLNGNGQDNSMPKSRYSLVYLAALLALIVILTEWGVYQRGRSI